MKTYVLFCFAVICFVTVSAKRATCMPKKYEAATFGSVGVSGGEFREYYDVVGSISVDYDHMMAAYDQDVTVNNNGTEQSIHQMVYQDWKKKVEYVHREDTKNCTKMPIPIGVFHDFCRKDLQSDDVSMLMSFKVGDKMADVMWYDVDGVMGLFTLYRDSLTPISSFSAEKIMGVGSATGLVMGNITTGIKDANVFKLPDTCV